MEIRFKSRFLISWEAPLKKGSVVKHILETLYMIFISWKFIPYISILKALKNLARQKPDYPCTLSCFHKHLLPADKCRFPLQSLIDTTCRVTENNQSDSYQMWNRTPCPCKGLAGSSRGNLTRKWKSEGMGWADVTESATQGIKLRTSPNPRAKNLSRA